MSKIKVYKVGNEKTCIASGLHLYILIRSTTTDDSNLLEKLKEMAKNSKTDESFDTHKFAELLDEYTRGL